MNPQSIVEELVSRARLSRAQRRRIAADLRAHVEDALEAGQSIEDIRTSLGDAETLSRILAAAPPPVRRSRAFTSGVAVMAATLAWYIATAVRLGTFGTATPASCDGASIQNALHLLRVAKGVQSPSISARVLEPFYFATVGSPADVEIRTAHRTSSVCRSLAP